MARITTDPNYSSPTFPRATAGTDLFVKEDVQALAAAVSTHDHSTGKGAALTAGAIPSGTITSAMIANGTIVAADIATGTITSNEIADGTIATADLANASVTNAKLATDTDRSNLLCNGGIEVWQRGNGPFTANGAYGSDRWMVGVGASSTLSVIPDATNVDSVGNSKFAAACTYVLSGGYGNLTQKIEDFTQLRGLTVTFSVRVRTATASAVQAAIQYNGATLVTGTTHTGGGTWQTLNVTLAVPNNITALSVFVLFNASCTAYVDNAMLVVGSQAADYAPMHPADDLARCLRYYETIGDGGSYPMVIGYNGVGGAIYTGIALKAVKAVSPTVTKNGTWQVFNTVQPTILNQTLHGVVFAITATAAGIAYANVGAVGQNVTIESNP